VVAARENKVLVMGPYVRGRAGPILVCGGGIPEILGGSVCPWGHNLGLVCLPYYWWAKVQLPSSERAAGQYNNFLLFI
jgi:hypothetical protein